MQKTVSIFIFLIFLGFFSGISAQTSNPKGKVFLFSINDEIAKPVWLRTQKALAEAKRIKASYVLIHMNTYGGELSAADSIRTAILNAPMPVMVFIDNNAASAGALISIACDSIYMRTGANIGAATVVNQNGEPMPDKYQSYMRGLMRSTAQATGRNADIAQAMVDGSYVVEHVNDSGKVVTFTADEAMKNGYCNSKAESVNDVLKNAGLSDYELIEQHLTAADKIIGFLTKPLVAGILIMLIIAGIYFEFQSPGAVFPIAIAAAAALMYFAPHYINGLADNWEIIIFVVGVILLAVEIFAIPGFGVTGIAGIFLMIMGLTLAMIDNIGFSFSENALQKTLQAFFIVISATFVSVAGSLYLTRKLFGGRTIFGDLALTEQLVTAEGNQASDVERKSLVGSTGTALTILRPAGKIILNDKPYDAVSQYGYIEKNDPVIVVKYENAQLIVNKIEVN